MFQKTLKHSVQKPNKVWVDKGSEFYKRPTKSWLDDTIIGIYAEYNKWKSLVAEQFIFILKNKINK